MEFNKDNMTAIKITDTRGAVFRGSGHNNALRAIELWAMKGSAAQKVAYVVFNGERKCRVNLGPSAIGELNREWGLA